MGGCVAQTGELIGKRDNVTLRDKRIDVKGRGYVPAGVTIRRVLRWR